MPGAQPSANCWPLCQTIALNRTETSAYALLALKAASTFCCVFSMPSGTCQSEFPCSVLQLAWQGIGLEVPHRICNSQGAASPL